MEDSESRRARLNAMRVVAAEAEASGNPGPTGVLVNPLLETPAANSEVQFGTSRFDFYTDPMAAFSANKRAMRGPRNPAMSSCPAMPMNEGVRPEAWRGRPPYRGMNPPYPMNQWFGGNSNYGRGRGDWRGGGRGDWRGGGGGGSGGVHQNFRQGRGQWRGNSVNQGVPRGGGRGRGFRFHGSIENETIGPERFYDKSMVEDPWQNIQPVVWKGLDASNSMVSKYINMKKPRVSEPSLGEGSGAQQQSLAAYLAASFNEAANDASSV